MTKALVLRVEYEDVEGMDVAKECQLRLRRMSQVVNGRAEYPVISVSVSAVASTEEEPATLRDVVEMLVRISEQLANGGRVP